MHKPLVSVLVPIYNVEAYIQRCATSLLEQTYPNIEYIFVNDSTPDHSIIILEKVLQRYPNRKNYQIINHKTNQGLAAARNTGLQYASGDWITFVDSDDYLDKDAIQKLIDNALLNKADIVVGNYYIKNYNNIITNKWKKDNFSRNEYLNLLLQWNKIELTLWGKLFKRELFIEHNLTSINGCDFGEDFALTPRVCYYAQKISFLPQPIYYYECSNQNSYTKNISTKSLKSLIKVATIIYNFYSTKKDFTTFQQSLSLGIFHMKLWMCRNKIFKPKYYSNLPKITPLHKNSSSKYFLFIKFLINNRLYRIAYILLKFKSI